MKLPEPVEIVLARLMFFGAQAAVLFVIYMYLSGEWYYR